MTAGALAYWLLEIARFTVLRAFAPEIVERPLLYASTLLISSTLLIYSILLRWQRESTLRPSIAIHMLAGIWLFGGFLMMILMFLGGLNELGPVAALFFAVLFAVIPVYTLIGSTYVGSVVALLAVTWLLPALHLAFERGTWVIRPPRHASQPRG